MRKYDYWFVNAFLCLSWILLCSAWASEHNSTHVEGRRSDNRRIAQWIKFVYDCCCLPESSLNSINSPTDFFIAVNWYAEFCRKKILAHLISSPHCSFESCWLALFWYEKYFCGILSGCESTQKAINTDGALAVNLLLIYMYSDLMLLMETFAIVKLNKMSFSVACV